MINTTPTQAELLEALNATPITDLILAETLLSGIVEISEAITEPLVEPVKNILKGILAKESVLEWGEEQVEIFHNCISFILDEINLIELVCVMEPLLGGSRDLSHSAYEKPLTKINELLDACLSELDAELEEVEEVEEVEDSNKPDLIDLFGSLDKEDIKKDLVESVKPVFTDLNNIISSLIGALTTEEGNETTEHVVGVRVSYGDIIITEDGEELPPIPTPDELGVNIGYAPHTHHPLVYQGKGWCSHTKSVNFLVFIPEVGEWRLFVSKDAVGELHDCYYVEICDYNIDM